MRARPGVGQHGGVCRVHQCSQAGVTRRRHAFTSRDVGLRASVLASVLLCRPLMSAEMKATTDTPAATPTTMSRVCMRPSRRKRSATRRSKPSQAFIATNGSTPYRIDQRKSRHLHGAHPAPADGLGAQARADANLVAGLGSISQHDHITFGQAIQHSTASSVRRPRRTARSCARPPAPPAHGLKCRLLQWMWRTAASGNTRARSRRRGLHLDRQRHVLAQKGRGLLLQRKTSLRSRRRCGSTAARWTARAAEKRSRQRHGHHGRLLPFAVVQENAHRPGQ